MASHSETEIIEPFRVPPHIMGKDTSEPLIVRQWRAGYFGEPSHQSSRLRALRELDSDSSTQSREDD